METECCGLKSPKSISSSDIARIGAPDSLGRTHEFSGELIVESVLTVRSIVWLLAAAGAPTPLLSPKDPKSSIGSTN